MQNWLRQYGLRVTNLNSKEKVSKHSVTINGRWREVRRGFWMEKWRHLVSFDGLIKSHSSVRHCYTILC